MVRHVGSNMSKNLFPIPVNTPLFDSNTRNISPPWMLYFKAMGDDLITANIATNIPTNPNFKYVVNGNTIFCTYYVTTLPATDAIIQLPYTSLLAFDVNGQIYSPGTKTITILKSINYVHFWFVANLI